MQSFWERNSVITCKIIVKICVNDGSEVIIDFHLPRQRLWEEIDAEIGGLRNSEIYTYKPDLISDPFSESGCVWSFNFFFYNAKIKRIVFLNCRAMKYVDLIAKCDY